MYIKQSWKNLPDTTTPLNSSRLNHLETQFDEAKSYIDGVMEGLPSQVEEEVYNLVSTSSVLSFGAKGDASTDDTSSIQDALSHVEAQGGGVLVFPPGEYLISDFLVVGSNTTIFAFGAHVKNVAGRGLIRNFWASDIAPGYTGRGNISIYGGVWDQFSWNGVDGVKGGVTTALNFVHGHNIKLVGVTVRDVHGGHAVEFNAIDGGVVEDCIFEGFSNGGDTSRNISEAVQIDCALNIVMEPKDLTPAKNISIKRSVSRGSKRLGPWGRFAGSHTGVSGNSGVVYDNITVSGNVMVDCLTWGVYGYGWINSKIKDNTVSNPGLGGIACVVPLSSTWGYSMTLDGISIIGNRIISPGGNGIRVIGDVTSLGKNIEVVGNHISRSNGDAILIEDLLNPIVAMNQVNTTLSGAGVMCRSKEATVFGNTIRDTDTNAINVQRYPHSQVVENTVVGTRGNYGIFVGPDPNSNSATNVTIKGNFIKEAFTASIRLSTAASGCRIVLNRIVKGDSSATKGILNVAGATGAIIVGNDLSGNGWSSSAIDVSTSNPVFSFSGSTSRPGDNLI